MKTRDPHVAGGELWCFLKNGIPEPYKFGLFDCIVKPSASHVLNPKWTVQTDGPVLLANFKQVSTWIWSWPNV
jgi:hypothetical protein